MAFHFELILVNSTLHGKGLNLRVAVVACASPHAGKTGSD